MVIAGREFADRQNAGDRHWLDDGSAGVELRDAQVDGFFGEAERLENRFQWVNSWCLIFGR